MINLNIPASQSTPSITSDFDTGVLTIKGDSYPENSYEFFASTIQWIKDYIESQANTFQLKLDIIYMNTSSVKSIMDIFDILESAHTDGKPVSVNWLYDTENERVKELAEEFYEDYTFPFEILAND